MKKYFQLAMFTVIIVLGCLKSNGQNNKWLNYLNGSKVNQVIQQDNNLWIATIGGLVKMDMTSNVMTFFNKANSGLPSNNILSIAANSNELWIGTDMGLVKFDNTAWSIYNTSNSPLPSNYINKIFEKSSVIYIATQLGLAIYDQISWQVFDITNSSLPGDNITDVDVDSHDSIWLCIRDYWGYQGTGKFDLFTWKELMTDGFPMLYIDLYGNKWVGTQFSGIYKYDISGNCTIYNNLLTDCIKDIKSDSLGNIWVALQDAWTPDGGLAKFDGSSWTYYTTTNSNLISDELNSLFVDNSNNIWFGIMSQWNGLMEEGAGLVKFDNSNFNYFNTSNSPVKRYRIDDIAIDKTQKIWLNYYFSASQNVGGGMQRFDGNSWQDYPSPYKSVTGLSFDNQNYLWISSLWQNTSGSINDGGVLNYDYSNWTYYNTTNSILTTKGVSAIYVDSKNNVWIGADGLYKIDSLLQWNKFTTSNSNLPTNFIYIIKSFINDELWISSGIDYIYKYNGFSWDAISLPFQSGQINDFEIDSNNVLWIATSPLLYGPPVATVSRGGGLLRYDGVFSIFNTSNSAILSNSVRAIEIAKNQSIWIGTNMGLGKFDHSVFTNFDIYNSPLSGQSISSLAIANNGNIWIGTEWGDGVSVYNPNGINVNIENVLIKNSSRVEIFPNPFSNQAIIKLSEGSLQHLKTVKLYSMDGKEISINYYISNNEIILFRDNLIRGLYMLKVQTNENIYNSKIIVN